MTRTLIVSDLHLGGLSGVDLLRRPGLRAALLDEFGGIDRLVLLGDVLELRHGPPHEALADARAFFEEVGRALGAGRELVITAGNHDHLMVCGWLDDRALGEPAPEPLGLEQRFAPAEASPMLARIEQWAAPARVTVAYPGLWIRPDVYAMHGHFLDAHLTIPTLERIGVGTMGRLLERPPSALATVADYEAVTAPIYAWRDAITRYSRAGAFLNGLATARAWRALGGTRDGSGGRDGIAPHAETALRDGGGPRDGVAPRDGAASCDGVAPCDEIASRDEVASRDGAALRDRVASRDGVAPRDGIVARYASGGRRMLRAGRAAARRSAIRGGFPLMVGGLNRAGLGPVNANISRTELRRAGLAAMGEVAARLGLGDAYLVFGHTHRAGPFPGDPASEWRGRGGTRLVNCGCWTYDSVFLTPTPGESPYWPGTAVLVEDTGPPVLKRLLLDRTHAELAPGQTAAI